MSATASPRGVTRVAGDPGDVEPVLHESRDRIITGLVTALPVLALVVAAWQSWDGLLNFSDLIVFGVLYVLTGLGVTVGFHRHLTHRSFKARPEVRGILAMLGSAAIEGPVISWVADHRKHHAFADRPGDPHSPHVDHGIGWTGALRGLLHAHVGWLFRHDQRGARARYAPDLLADPLIRFVDRTFVVWALGGLAVAFGLGVAIGGSIATGLTGLLWGGGVRLFVLHHATYSINSICHVFGRRSFSTADESRNVFWLALPSFGESWHNNHHAFPTSARHGLGRGQLDLSAIVIRGLERCGLAWDVVRVSPEHRRRKATSPPRRGGRMTYAREESLSAARRHRASITVVVSLATAALLVWLLSGRRQEFADALSGAGLWVLAITALLQVLALLARSEAWHLTIGAAGGAVDRRVLYRASSMQVLGSVINGNLGVAARIAALRRSSPEVCPQVPTLIAAEFPILAVEALLAALASFTLVGPLGVPWWLPLIAFAVIGTASAGLRHLATRKGRELWSGLAVVRSARGGSRVIAFVLVAVFAQIFRNWLLLHAAGVDASFFDAIAVLIAVVTLGQLPVGPSVGAAAAVLILGSDGVAAAAAAGVLMTVTGTIGGLCFAAWAAGDRLWSGGHWAALREE